MSSIRYFHAVAATLLAFAIPLPGSAAAAQQPSGRFGDAIVFTPSAYTPQGVASLLFSPLPSQDRSRFGEAIVFARAPIRLRASRAWRTHRCQARTGAGSERLSCSLRAPTRPKVSRGGASSTPRRFRSDGMLPLPRGHRRRSERRPADEADRTNPALALCSSQWRSSRLRERPVGGGKSERMAGAQDGESRVRAERFERRPHAAVHKIA